MATSVDELATKAMALPGEARALLAERLVESLDQESVSEIWLTEAKKRRDEVRSGRVKAIPGVEVMEEFESLLMINDILIPSRSTIRRSLHHRRQLYFNTCRYAL